MYGAKYKKLQLTKNLSYKVIAPRSLLNVFHYVNKLRCRTVRVFRFRDIS